MEFHEVLRQRRTALGISQSALAAAAGVDARQIKRYEAGQAQPVLRLAVNLADVLGITLTELAGLTKPRPDLNGRWWSAWQGTKNGAEVLTTQELILEVDRATVQVHALARGAAAAAAAASRSYLWSGELKMWDDETLIGWYAAINPATRSKGTLYLVLQPDTPQQITGRWVGHGHDTHLETGWGALARARPEARRVLDTLRDEVSA